MQKNKDIKKQIWNFFSGIWGRFLLKTSSERFQFLENLRFTTLQFYQVLLLYTFKNFVPIIQIMDWFLLRIFIEGRKGKQRGTTLDNESLLCKIKW